MVPVSAKLDSPVKTAWFSYEARSIPASDPSADTASSKTLLARGSVCGGSPEGASASPSKRVVITIRCMAASIFRRGQPPHAGTDDEPREATMSSASRSGLILSNPHRRRR
jgi:hypothetical protein